MFYQQEIIFGDTCYRIGATIIGWREIMVSEMAKAAVVAVFAAVGLCLFGATGAQDYWGGYHPSARAKAISSSESLWSVTR